jgi:outer membrane protein OmpA-like peptidoglycan-associated protein
MLKTFEGSGSPPVTLDWIVDADQTTVPRAPGTLDYHLHAEDLAGGKIDTNGSLPVVQVTLRNKRREVQQTANGLAEIEHYTLVLFDFGSSDLTSDITGQNERTLALIKSKITNRSRVSIRGFGDRIGNIEYTRQLGDARALRAAKALGLSESAIVPSDGLTHPFNNDLPEGRFYSRTVEITIRTSIDGSN